MRPRRALVLALVVLAAGCEGPSAAPAELRGEGFRLTIDLASGSMSIAAAGGAAFSLAPRHPAAARLRVGDETLWLDRVRAAQVVRSRARLDYRVEPGDGPAFPASVVARLVDGGRAVELSLEAPERVGSPPRPVTGAFAVGVPLAGAGSAELLLPVGGGRLAAAAEIEGGFRLYEGSGGLTMPMLGLAAGRSGLLLRWRELDAELRTRREGSGAEEALALTLWGPRRLRIEPTAPGPGEPTALAVARADRALALAEGRHRPLAERAGTRTALAGLAGALPIKPLLATGIAGGSRFAADGRELHAVHATTAALERMVEHLSRDLGIDRALLVPTGWIRGGYDFSYPDVWPPDEEIGGAAGLRSLSGVAREAGWLFGLHDNYEIAFRSQPSADPTTALAERNLWFGGPHLVVDPRAQLATAMRNLDLVVPAVEPDAYFLDATTAGRLLEDADRDPPLTREASVAAGRALLDAVAERVRGPVGSEDGQEWAIGHVDWLEGLASSARFPGPGAPYPLFELVHHDEVVLGWHQADSVGLASRHTEWNREIADAGALLELLATARMPLFRPPHGAWWTEPVPDALEVTNPFARADGGWAEGLHPLDALLKNLFEVFSPTARLAAQLPMNGFERDRGGNARSWFGRDDLNVLVRTSDGPMPADWLPGPPLRGRVVPAPRSGFVVSGAGFLAWHGWATGRTRDDGADPPGEPALFTISSLDGEPLDRSRRLRVYHGFGPDELTLAVDARRVRVGDAIHAVADGRVTVRVPREAVVELQGRR